MTDPHSWLDNFDVEADTALHNARDKALIAEIERLMALEGKLHGKSTVYQTLTKCLNVVKHNMKGE